MVVGVVEAGEEEEAVAAGVVTEEVATEITDNSNLVVEIMTSNRKVENIPAEILADIFFDQLLTLIKRRALWLCCYTYKVGFSISS